MVNISSLGLREGNYTSWTWKWTNRIPPNLFSDTTADFYIDEDNKVIVMSWLIPSANRRFAILNLVDFSTKFMSPEWPDYTFEFAKHGSKRWMTPGSAFLEDGGISHSLKTYFLIFLTDRKSIEVWRAGAAPLWTRDVTGDFLTTNSRPSGGLISPSGRYILVLIEHRTELVFYLMLYEGN